MKIFGKKIPKGSTLLFASFTAVSVCLLLIISAIRIEKVNNMSSNTLYTDNRHSFTLLNAGEDAWNDVVSSLMENGDNFAVYYTIPDKDIVIRGILVKGMVQNPPMIRGTFFDETYSWGDIPCVVIGKELEKDTYETSEGVFYDYQGVSYNVLGVMGTEMDSRINHMMFLDFQSALNIAGVNGEYFFDADDYDTVKSASGIMSRNFKYPADFFMFFSENKQNDSIILRLFSSKNIMNTMYIMTFISFSLCTILVTFIWLKHRRQQFFVWNIMGYRKKWKMIEMAKQYYKVAIAGYFMGIGIMQLILSVMNEFTYTWGDVIETFLVTIGFGTVVMFGCFFMKERYLT